MIKTQRTLAPQRHPKIAHLSETDINQMIDNYYNGKNTREILNENKISFYPSGIIKLFPPVIVKETSRLVKISPLDSVAVKATLVTFTPQAEKIISIIRREKVLNPRVKIPVFMAAPIWAHLFGDYI